MCGCTPTGSNAAKAFVAAPQGTATTGQAPLVNAQYFAPQKSGNLVAQTNVNDGRVRDANLAEQTLARLKYATQHLQTPEQARAAGYKPNPSAPDHWINDDVFRVRNGYDLNRPATVMFESGKLVGVMLSHDPRKGAPPDLGAGSWHTHGGTANEEYAAHIWFNKPLNKAFGTETGDV